MTDGVKPLIGTDAFTSFLGLMQNPLFGIGFGLVLTVIVQSSSATVGMLQTVASVPGSGVTFAMAYPVIMGINLGTCVTTAMVCSIGSSKDSKRTGVVHILFNTIGTVLFMIVMTIMQNMAVFGAEFWVATVDSGSIANFQTIFNLITAVVLIPFNGLLVKASMCLVKDEKEKEAKHPELLTLSENLYISPAVAVSEATKAVAAMADMARVNFQKATGMFANYDEAVVAEINEDEDCIDAFKDSADRFMIGLSKVVETQADDNQVDLLIQTIPNFERIGDYATDLVELAEKLKSESNGFSDVALKELELLSKAVNEIIAITVSGFGDDTDDIARTVEPLEETIDDMIMILRDRHTKRLKSGACSIGSGLIFMEALTHFERASDQCSTVAVMMLARHNDQILLNHHDYLREIHTGNDRSYRKEKERRAEQYIKALKEIQ